MLPPSANAANASLPSLKKSAKHTIANSSVLKEPVLWEHLREGKPLMGWTDNYIRVQLAEGATSTPDKLGRVRLGNFTENEEALIATPVE